MLSAAACSLFMSAAESITTTAGNIDSHQASANPVITQLTDGTGANKAQKVGRQVLTLSTTPLDVDLTAFAGGINGVNINFSKIKEVYLKNLDLAIVVTVGGTAGSPTNAWTNYVNGTFPISPGAIEPTIDHGTGIVVDGTHKLLRIVAASGTPQVELILVGEGT